MLSKEEVQHIAKLARINLTEEETGKFQEQLALILDYIEKLKEVDVSNVEPASHAVKVENVLRKDKAAENQENENKKLQDLAPKTKDGFLKVKQILK
ncbi:MAG: Asp-tRNA(Asn)/Glu-tRNA(Gln) amidotransferase subunit GatC [Candidatus Pacebacteria bacterium]|nr:Asp-tRNA(Asn)/Glu-tRNA(Gln) amidotransferase subunit GatC [Candidatus Paceibacterota bacterium]